MSRKFMFFVFLVLVSPWDAPLGVISTKINVNHPPLVLVYMYRITYRPKLTRALRYALKKYFFIFHFISKVKAAAVVLLIKDVTVQTTRKIKCRCICARVIATS